MKIIKVPIEKCKIWDKNPRGITKKDFERLKKQIQKLGVYKPLIACQENGKYIILGGNMRLRALQELGYKEVELSIIEAKSEKEKIEYSLSDNDRVGYYEEEKLAELIYPHIDELELEDFKIDIGEAISLKDVVEDFGPDIDDEKADEAPEIDDTPAITRPGDLYQLGRHRLLCGDATKEEDIKRLLDGVKVDLVLTDPPYGVGMNYLSYEDLQEKLLELISKWFPLWQKYSDLIVFTPGNQNIFLYPKSSWVLGWFYGSGAAVTPWGFNNWQPILVYGKDPKLKNKLGCFPDAFFISPGRKDSDINHPTPKPLNFWEALMERTTARKGEIIADPFSGSGVSFIAAEKFGHICYGMEIEPKYCDVIIKRFSEYAGIREEEIRKTRQAAK